MPGASSVDTAYRRQQAEFGRQGARRRWGPPRVLRLDTLPESVRAAIEAMVTAEANARARESEGRP